MKKTEVASATMLDVLSQRKWWRTRQDGAVRRRDMDIRHKANTVAWLLTHAEEVTQRINNEVPYEGYGSYGERDAAEAAAQEMLAQPIAWMIQQPFVQALLRDLAGAAGILFEASLVAGDERDYQAGWFAGHAAAFKAMQNQIDAMPRQWGTIRRQASAALNRAEQTS